jgi:hypothetical protein
MERAAAVPYIRANVDVHVHLGDDAHVRADVDSNVHPWDSPDVRADVGADIGREGGRSEERSRTCDGGDDARGLRHLSSPASGDGGVLRGAAEGTLKSPQT